VPIITRSLAVAKKGRPYRLSEDSVWLVAEKEVITLTWLRFYYKRYVNAALERYNQRLCNICHARLSGQEIVGLLAFASEFAYARLQLV